MGWIGKSTEVGGVDYEGRLDYCGRCKRHGHTRVDCRKMGRTFGERAAGSSRPGVGSEGLPVGSVCRNNDAVLSEQMAGKWTVVQRKKKGYRSGVVQNLGKAVVQEMVVGESSDGVSGISGERDSGIVEQEPVGISSIHGQVDEGVRMQEDSPRLELPLVADVGGSQEGFLSVQQGVADKPAVPQMVVQNIAVQSPFLRRMQDSIEDCMARLFDQEKMRAQGTMYRRMLSVDDSALGCSSSEVNDVHVGDLVNEPLRLCYRSDWQQEMDSLDERVARLRRERDQCRRTTRSATKSTSSHTS